MTENICRVTQAGSQLEYRDFEGDELTISIWSNGETTIGVKGMNGKAKSVLLSNRAAHELRDFLNRRFPNATGAQ